MRRCTSWTTYNSANSSKTVDSDKGRHVDLRYSGTAGSGQYARHFCRDIHLESHMGYCKKVFCFKSVIVQILEMKSFPKILYKMSLKA